MKKVIVLLSLALIASLYVNSTTFLDFSYGRTDSTLIEQWTAIQPGEPIQDVIDRMGDYSHHIDKGKKWGGAEAFNKHIPEAYRESHEVYIYYIGGWGPYLLYILVNDEGNVAYTWAWST